MGLIPNEVIGFFSSSDPSSCTVALGSTQSVTKRVPGIFLVVRGDGHIRLRTPLPSVSWLFRKMWEPECLKTLWACMACYRDSFTIRHCPLPGIALCDGTTGPWLWKQIQFPECSACHVYPRWWTLPSTFITNQHLSQTFRRTLNKKCLWESDTVSQVWPCDSSNVFHLLYRELYNLTIS
jgi:hypothetical protein